MGYHAKLSPSSAHRWTDCTASINAQEGIPNENSEASMNGTCCHQMGAECLEDPTLDPQDYLGRKMMFWVHKAAGANGEDWREAFIAESEDDLGLPVIDYIPPIIEYTIDVDGVGDDLPMRDSGDFTATVEVTQEMVDAVITYVDFVRERAELLGAEMHIEKRVPIGHFTGEGNYWLLDGEKIVPNPDEDHDQTAEIDSMGGVWVSSATGTSDAILLFDETIESVDAKFGRHKVHAYEIIEPARGDQPPKMRMNLQLACYVLGSLEQYGKGRKITRCKATIVQPFLNHVSEYECSIEELLELRDNFLAVKAEETRTKPVFKPSYDNCHFCRARNPEDPEKRCKARESAVVSMALDGFTDVGEPILKGAPASTELGTLYGALDFVREWCDDIAKRVYNELSAGREVMRADGLRYVLVQGRKGDRKWDDPEEVEKLLKHMRLRTDEMYTMKVIGPAAVEKLAHVPKRKKADAPPPRLNKLQWQKLQTRITQSEGGMSVALETDTRPALPMSAEGFVDVPDADDCSDLLN